MVIKIMMELQRTPFAFFILYGSTMSEGAPLSQCDNPFCIHEIRSLLLQTKAHS